MMDEVEKEDDPGGPGAKISGADLNKFHSISDVFTTIGGSVIHEGYEHILHTELVTTAADSLSGDVASVYVALLRADAIVGTAANAFDAANKEIIYRFSMDLAEVIHVPPLGHWGMEGLKIACAASSVPSDVLSTSLKDAYQAPKMNRMRVLAYLLFFAFTYTSSAWCFVDLLAGDSDASMNLEGGEDATFTPGTASKGFRILRKLPNPGNEIIEQNLAPTDMASIAGKAYPAPDAPDINIIVTGRSAGYSQPAVSFTSPTPANNTNNSIYPVVFNMTSSTEMESCYLEIDGANYTGTLASNNFSCSYALPFATYNHTYSGKGYANISGTFYATNETRSFSYYGCGYLDETADLITDIAGAPIDIVISSGSEMPTNPAACIFINASNIVLDCANHEITGDGTPSEQDNIGIALNDSLTNVTIKNCRVSNYTYGIYSYGTNYFNIANTTAYNMTPGIYSAASDGIFIVNGINDSFSNNLIQNNQRYGIYIENVNYSIISDTVSRYNLGSGSASGIALGSPSSYNTIRNITANNNHHAFYLDSFTDNNLITNCSSYDNDYGFYLYHTANNVITNSTFHNNTEWQISMIQSTNSTAYNNIINATGTQGVASDDYSFDPDLPDRLPNFWNTTLDCTTKNIISGNCTGGNWYSDYNGQNTNGDGIRDTDLPYSIYGGEDKDYLPLSNNLSIPYPIPPAPPESTTLQIVRGASRFDAMALLTPVSRLVWIAYAALALILLALESDLPRPKKSHMVTKHLVTKHR